MLDEEEEGGGGWNILSYIYTLLHSLVCLGVNWPENTVLFATCPPPYFQNFLRVFYTSIVHLLIYLHTLENLY